MRNNLLFIFLFVFVGMTFFHSCKSNGKVNKENMEKENTPEKDEETTNTNPNTNNSSKDKTNVTSVTMLKSALNDSKQKVIILENKVYEINSTLNITRPVIIKGKEGSKIQLNVLDNNGVFINNAENVTLENIEFVFNDGPLNIPKNTKFKKSGLNKADYISRGINVNSGVHINKSKNITIRNCSFKNWIGDGVLVWSSTDILIEGNKFQSPYFLVYSSDIHIKGRKDALSQRIQILKNECNSNNRHGISIGNGGYVNNVLAKDNKIITDFRTLGDKHLRNHGILCFYGTNKDPGNPVNSDIVLDNNFIKGTRNTGIYVPGGYAVTIKNNTLQHVGLSDGVKISGGILVGNDLNSAIIEDNEISNYKGTFEERGAIGTFGTTKGNNGSIEIRRNKIHHCTNGIALDQEMANVIIEDNILDNIDKSNLFVRKNINVKQRKGKITVKRNTFKRNLIESYPSVRINTKNLETLDIQANTLEGNPNSECFEITSNKTDLDISNNNIKDFGAAFSLERRAAKTDKVNIANNNIENVEEVSSKKGKFQMDQSEISKNRVKLKKSKNH